MAMESGNVAEPLSNYLGAIHCTWPATHACEC